MNGNELQGLEKWKVKKLGFSSWVGRPNPVQIPMMTIANQIAIQAVRTFIAWFMIRIVQYDKSQASTIWIVWRLVLAPESCSNHTIQMWIMIRVAIWSSWVSELGRVGPPNLKTLTFPVFWFVPLKIVLVCLSSSHIPPLSISPLSSHLTRISSSLPSTLAVRHCIGCLSIMCRGACFCCLCVWHE